MYYLTSTSEDDSGGALAAWISYERLLTEKLGLDLMVADADYDFVFGEEFGFDYDLIPVTVSANFHLIPDNERLDFYAAPTIGVSTLKLKVPSQTLYILSQPVYIEGGTETASSFTWGGALGLDVRLGASRWVFTIQGRFLAASFKFEGDSESEDFNNAIGQAGFGIRF